MEHWLAKEISRSLLEKARCLLSNARLIKSFWAEAIVYASHLINGLSSTAMEVKLHKKFGLKKLLKVMVCCRNLKVKATLVPKMA